jgi:hypothetical protein
MITIHKYGYNVNDGITVPVQDGAKLLDVQMQFGHLAFWFLVDTDAPVRPITYLIYGTGHEVKSVAGVHVATVQDLGGHLVWHILESAV